MHHEFGNLWHRRLGHLHYRALPVFEKMVKGMPKLSNVHNDVCKGCAIGKNTKGSFHKSESRSKVTLCGPTSIASPSGFLYYVTFIDDYSRKT